MRLFGVGEVFRPSEYQRLDLLNPKMHRETLTRRVEDAAGEDVGRLYRRQVDLGQLSVAIGKEAVSPDEAHGGRARYACCAALRKAGDAF